MKYITVSELKEILDDMPQNAPVVVEFGDHSYRLAKAYNTTALYDGSNILTEDIFIGEIGETTEHGKRIPVLLVD